jgi:hypothetical protein
MKPRDARAKAISSIVSHAWARESVTALLEAHIAETHDELEEATELSAIYKLQGRVQLAREILTSINKITGS